MKPLGGRAWDVWGLRGLAWSPATRLPLTQGLCSSWQVLPIIVFFSCVMSVLYYVGLMQWVILKVSLSATVWTLL